MEASRVPYDAQVHREIGEGYELLAVDRLDGTYGLDVLVSGAYCAACIQKIESSLKAKEVVRSARLNFSTGKLSVEWSGDPAAANDLVKTVIGLGYGVRPYDDGEEKKAVQQEEKFLLLCLGISGFAAGNIMLISVGLWTSTTEQMGIFTKDLMHWLSALIAIPAIMFSGRPFFRSALRALKAGSTNMDVPISIGVILACGMSLYETAMHGSHAYFDSAVMLIFILLIGRYLDFRARKNARSVATDLLSSIEGFASLYEDGKIRHVPVRQLKEGQIIRVAAGDKFPVDGIVVEGQSDVDLSLITGETVPVNIGLNAEVYAGTINISAPILVRVGKVAENTLLADIVRLMEKAGQGQAKYVRYADRIARLYTPVIHTVSLFAFLGWMLIGHAPWQDALLIAITVLIITCPCALGLAVPVVQVLATGKLMKEGIVVKSGDALERLAAIDKILLDKTGTLTLGRPVLVDFYREEDLRVAASLAAHSNHPLSRAIVSVCSDKLLPAINVIEHPGMGLEGDVHGRRVRLGSRSYCGPSGAQDLSRTELWLNIEGDSPVPFVFTDELRHDSEKTIVAFHRAGLYPILVSGDQENTVRNVAQTCHIEEYYSEQKPDQKFSFMERVKGKGHRVLMVGDGLNDAPTLAGADVSMAPGTALSITQNAADIVFLGDNFMPVYRAWAISRQTQKLVKQNFMLALVYNLFAIPLAVGGFVTPFIAALAMSGSSLLVIANSFRLRWFA